MLTEKLVIVGNLKARELVSVISEVDARIDHIGFTEGHAVAAGQTLFRMDDRKLAARVAETEARFALATAELTRARRLLDNGSIAQQALDEALAAYQTSEATLALAREQLSDAVIIAPFAGAMTERRVSTGQFVTRGQYLVSLVQTDPLEVEFNLPERYLGQVGAGQTVSLSTAAWPDATFAGRIVFIAPQIDPASRTVLVKAELANPDGRLRPGMFGNLAWEFRVRARALVVPEAAIQFQQETTLAVVVNAEGRADFRTVQVGMRLAGQAEILSGLAAGERVVVEGFQKMGPGSRVQISPDSRRYGIAPDAPAN
jgi:membrane fusion protein (multidrug efflux system)